jgi:hypothetical protein
LEGRLEDKYGLQPVYEPQAKSQVDIIFVHGLGGSAKGAWTHEVGGFWPLWLQHKPELQNARILVFGYDADWKKAWKPGSILGVAEIATQLLQQLFHHCQKYRV